MAGSLNKVQIIGNLGRDPEVRYTADNRAIANVTVATSDSWTDKSGQKQEKTEWHRVVVFGKLAEVVEKYLKKGSNVYFEGKLQTRKWQGQDGQDKYTTEIVVDQFGGTMVMLGGRGGASSSDDSYFNQDSASGGMGGGASAGSMSTSKVSEEPAFDDDIPF